MLEEALEPYKVLDVVMTMLATVKKAPNTAFVFDVSDASVFQCDGPGVDLTVDDGEAALVKEALRLLNAHFKVADANVEHEIDASCSPCPDDYADSAEAEYGGEHVEFKGEDSKVDWSVDHTTAHRNAFKDLDSSDLFDHAQIKRSDFNGCGLDYMTCRKRVDDENACVLIPRRS